MLNRVVAILLVLLSMVAATASADPRPFVRGSWQTLLQAHAGRPLAVHFWSLTCAPCLAELPQWRDTVKAGGVDVVLVTTDPPEDTPKVERTLKRAGLDKVESWGFADSFVEKLRFEIDREWRGELPLTILVTASGKRESRTGTLSRQDMESWLAESR
ncbi:thiol-disulfide isomerase [Magnetospirillum sp. ME-1]|uniref:TlpA family protein disulfide reductase n=1 Tax=Magnetospirillum sp. ME-1 TaxID=1639348 RepID=UPI000A17B1E9|nr:thiol-disulfide isomerase [Magnetospirillum sp. ME-1]ARJ65762.1 thiol-disulfide isomerase [Magnetospirillum sp. ME-1]